MKKYSISVILILFTFFSYAQTGGRLNGAADPAKVNGVDMDQIAGIGGLVMETGCKTCMEVLEKYPGSPDGVYTIDPDGSGPVKEFEAYCDMTTDGGGWTLVLLSNAGVSGCPRPYWNEAIDSVNVNGVLSADITSFDLLLGLAHWNIMGDRARLDMGDSPASLSHQAYYDFSLDESNYYALVMSNEVITTGSTSPGMYDYHNGRPFSTRDVDHDSSASNCSTFYYETAWWYGSCFSGSFWGGGLEAYQDAPYWIGSQSEYFNYGSIWLR